MGPLYGRRASRHTKPTSLITRVDLTFLFHFALLGCVPAVFDRIVCSTFKEFGDSGPATRHNIQEIGTQYT